ncbi:MAG TPA: DMT family transporter [Terriglobia bacterium]|nr:DMT family transporter [Terriglobia bacterium]
MHLPLWLLFAIVTLIFWGITGVTQKLSTNAISTELSFLWFVVAFIPIALIILLMVPLDWHMKAHVFWLAVIGGALNGLGAMTSFKALESGGKASIVVPLCYLYPLVTILLALLFLHERVTRVEVLGIVLALVAALLLSREAPPKDSPGGETEGKQDALQNQPGLKS